MVDLIYYSNLYFANYDSYKKYKTYLLNLQLLFYLNLSLLICYNHKIFLSNHLPKSH